MSAELIIANMLNTATITNIVGSRRALAQLPQNAAYPALVYQVITDVAQPHINYATERQMSRARVQFNPLAKDIATMKSIHTALRTVFDFKHNLTIGSSTVISVRLESLGVVERDNDTGIWTQPSDYILMYYP